MTQPGTVHLVDDDPAFLRAVTRLLTTEGFRVRSFPDPRAFLDSLIPGEPGCLILDLAMPGLDGLEVQRRLNQSGFTLPIIFLTGHGDIPTSVKAMKSGAWDFLTKPVHDDRLLQAVRGALKTAAARLAGQREVEGWHRRLARLTSREHEVLRHVIAGRLNKEIAATLGIGEHTIKVHRARGLAKLEVRSVADLVRLAERLGLPPAGPLLDMSPK